MTLTVGADPNQDFLKATGLREAPSPEPGAAYLEKIHRGYPLGFQISAGDVWGRYLTRVAAGEGTRNANGIAQLYFKAPGSGIVGSRFDRWLSLLIGQPLTLVIIVKHERPVPRADIFGARSVARPDDPFKSGVNIGGFVGDLHCDDPEFTARLMANAPLLDRLRRLHYPYIRLESGRAGFYWAGNEKDYAAMIREHGSYSEMMLAIMDDLVDLIEL